MIGRKSIFEYDNYREYLKDQFAYQKNLDPKFSYKSFGRLAGFKSTSFLFLVIKNEANLSQEAIDKVADGLKLEGDDRFYFRNLVCLNQAGGVEERQLYAQQILKSRGYRNSKPLQEHVFQYLTHWHHSAIREMVAMDDFREDSEWISERLNQKVSPQQVTKALSELVSMGMIKKDEAGRLVAIDDKIVSPDEVTASFAIQYHEESIKLGAESIRTYPRDLREISGTTFRLSTGGLLRVKEILQRFRKEIVEIVAQEKNTTGLYQLNLQLFPLAKITESPQVKGAAAGAESVSTNALKKIS